MEYDFVEIATANCCGVMESTIHTKCMGEFGRSNLMFTLTTSFTAGVTQTLIVAGLLLRRV